MTKENEVANKLLMHLFKNESMFTKNIEGFCRTRNVNNSVVMQYLKPYLNAKTKGWDDVAEWELNDKGREFAANRGWLGEEEKDTQRKRFEELQRENLILQNEKMKYEKKIRWWKNAAAILSAASAIVGAASGLIIGIFL